MYSQIEFVVKKSVFFHGQNVAAVSSTSTRAPIYKSFARGENIGDVTAKGECISNIADLVKRA